MRGFEVKEAERGRSVAQVEDAFARGRIGEADRELRLTRIREAQTPDELTALTRDLSLPSQDADPWVAGAVPAPPRSAPARLGSSSGATPLALLVAGVAVVAAGIAAIMLFAAADPSSTGGSVEESQAVPVESVESVVTPDGGLDARELRSVLRAYPDRFGTTDAVQLALSDGRLTVTVPVAGAEPRARMWEWTGEWVPLSGRTPVPRDVATVDLRTLDVRLLARNVEVARAALGADARVLSVVVSDAGAGPRVIVELVGKDTAGTLVTTTGGKVVRGIGS